MHWLLQTATIKDTYNDMQPASGTIQQLQNIGVAMRERTYGEPTCCSRDLKALAAGPSAPSSLLSQLVCTAIASDISTLGKHKHAKHADSTTTCTLPQTHVCNGN